MSLVPTTRFACCCSSLCVGGAAAAGSAARHAVRAATATDRGRIPHLRAGAEVRYLKAPSCAPPTGSHRDPAVVGTCVTDAARKAIDNACLDRLGIAQHTFATYHPADRFWTFQVIEAGIFVALALVLLAFTAWWVRRRIS
jgi:hypothetical protein